MTQQLNDVTLVINDIQQPYIGETLKIKLGLGESNVRNQTAGGGQTVPVFSENLDTKNAMVTVSVANTQENYQRVRAWKAAKNGNVIEEIGPAGSGHSVTISNAALINDPEFNFAQDGNVELEFKGNQAV